MDDSKTHDILAGFSIRNDRGFFFRLLDLIINVHVSIVIREIECNALSTALLTLATHKNFHRRTCLPWPAYNIYNRQPQSWPWTVAVFGGSKMLNMLLYRAQTSGLSCLIILGRVHRKVEGFEQTFKSIRSIKEGRRGFYWLCIPILLPGPRRKYATALVYNIRASLPESRLKSRA